jgi:hypothetical protein
MLRQITRRLTLSRAVAEQPLRTLGALGLSNDVDTLKRLNSVADPGSVAVSLQTRSLSAPAAASPFATANIGSPSKKRARRTFVPRIAAVQLTEKARTFFKALLSNPPRPEIIGVMLNYDQSKTGEPRMVFSFSFVTAKDIDPMYDEGVSLELVESLSPDSTETILVPKPPAESRLDGLPKLYVHHNGFLKVLGATVDVDTTTVTPILYDREGNRMDPNA